MDLADTGWGVTKTMLSKYWHQDMSQATDKKTQTRGLQSIQNLIQPLTPTPRHPQRPLPPLRAPIIRRLNNLATPLNRPPPKLHKILRRLPPPRIPRLAPHNHALPPRRRMKEPRHIRAQLVIPLVAREDEVLPHPREGKEVYPRVVGDAFL